MNLLRGFFWPSGASLKGTRLLLGAAFLLACTLWFVLGALAANDPSHSFVWGCFWILPAIILFIFLRLLKTRPCQSTR